MKPLEDGGGGSHFISLLFLLTGALIMLLSNQRWLRAKSHCTTIATLASLHLKGLVHRQYIVGYCENVLARFEDMPLGK